MAYDAIVAGARGLFFFGGHLKQAMKPADRKLGWNWTYWEHVQRPLLARANAAPPSTGITVPVTYRPARDDR